MNLIPFHSFADPERMVYVNPAQVFAVEPFSDGTDDGLSTVLGTRILSAHLRGMVIVLEDVETVVRMLTDA